jgi:DNA-binding IscR family transcriptional regulator
LIRATATLANMRSRERKIMSDLIAYVDHSVDLKFLSEKFKVDEKKLVKIANELEKLGILKKI